MSASSMRIRTSPMSRRRFFGSRSRQRRNIVRIPAGVDSGKDCQSGSLWSNAETVSLKDAPVEGPSAAQHLVDNDSESPDVHLPATGLSDCLFRPDIRGCSENGAGARFDDGKVWDFANSTAAIDYLRQTEIE